MTVTLNADRFTLLRLERGLAIRQLALDSGIDIAVLNRLDAGGINNAPSLTLAQFLRLADTLDADPGDLLSTEQSPPIGSADATDSDPATLGALLHDLTGSVPAVVLAAALGWTLPRTLAAADLLSAHLASAGMTVQQQSGRLALRALNDHHAAAVTAARQHPRASLSQRVITPHRARLVYRAMQRPLSQHALSEADRREIAVLMRAGILELDNNRDVALTPGVQTSLHPPEPTGRAASQPSAEPDQAR